MNLKEILMKKPSQSFLQSLSVEIITLQKQVKTLNLLLKKTETFKVQVETNRVKSILDTCQNNLIKIQTDFESQVERVEKVIIRTRRLMLINLIVLIVWTLSTYILFIV